LQERQYVVTPTKKKKKVSVMTKSKAETSLRSRSRRVERMLDEVFCNTTIAERRDLDAPYLWTDCATAIVSCFTRMEYFDRTDCGQLGRAILELGQLAEQIGGDLVGEERRREEKIMNH
jgi:hypothetical protein